MILDLLFHPKVRALPWRFKLFIFKYFMSIRNPDNVQELDGRKVLSIYLPFFPSKAFDNFVDAQLKASNGKAVPEIVNISLTTGCKNDCWHCKISGDRVDLDKDVLLRAIYGLKRLGTFQFLFTGGNPILREDLEEIVKATGDASVALVSTPGPIDLERAKSLKRAGCQGVLVGLEHYDEKKNDQLMGCKGAYKHSLKSIKNVKKAGMLAGCWIVVTSEMIPQLDRYLKFVKKAGATDVAIFEPMLTEKDKMLAPDERKYLLNIQKKSKKEHGYPRIISGPFMDSEQFMGCTAGFNRMHITAEGDVFPCDMLHEKWGNIYNDDVRDIWEKMHKNYSEPLCGCIALNKTESRLPAYYRNLIR